MAASNYSGYYYSAPIDVALPFEITPKFAICKGGSTSLINELKEIKVSDGTFRFWVYGLDKSATNSGYSCNRRSGTIKPADYSEAKSQ